MPSGFESFGNNQGQNNTFNVRSEAAAAEAPLAERIKNMSMVEISQLDIDNLSDEEFAAVEERYEQYITSRNAASTSPISSTEGAPINSVPETSPAPETASSAPLPGENLPPSIMLEKEKAANHSGFSKFVNTVGKKVFVAFTIGAVAAATLAGAAVHYFDKNSANAASTDDGTQTEQSDDQEEAETEIGIKDGYGEKGMWQSENKTGPYAFADAGEVAEVCKNDECEMLKYAADNQVETFADYMANLPEELKPDEFKGLNILETEKKLESLSDKKYEALQDKFNNTIDKAFTRRVTLNGKYDNAFMRLKDTNGKVNHDNMELVKCTTDEHNLEVTEFYWLDDHGHEIGSMIVKMSPVYDENGAIIGYEKCMQVLNPEGSDLYGDLPEIPNDNPNTGSEGTGSEGTGSEDTGSEGTGSEGTGSEGTGSEGTGSEGTGSEGTGSEGTDIKPKDSDNLVRIDDKIDKEIADDIGTDKIKHDPNPGVKEEDKTEKPSSNEHGGTKTETKQNENSKPAEKVETSKPENNHSDDKGGANSKEYAPVKDNNKAQEKADKAATPVKEAPTSKSDVADAMEDLTS